MTRTWLVIDVNNLGSRARHTTGDLDRGVVYGFLKQLRSLTEEFATGHCAFCFDSKHSARVKVSPEYKRNRREEYEACDGAEKERRAEYRNQLKELRTEILPAFGYKNVFVQRGREADDVIASVCHNLTPGDDAVIVSSDQDLYQLLGNRVTMYKPHTKQVYTHKHLAKEYFGLEPGQWFAVKALAGCAGDGVAGVRGVGDLTAAKFLRGRLTPGGAVYNRIVADTRAKLNVPLVKLPFEGTRAFTLTPDDVALEDWKRMARTLKMPGLLRSTY